MKTAKSSLIVIIAIAALSVSAQAGQVRSSARRVAPRTVVLNLYSQHKRQSPFFQTRSRVLLDRYFTRELANMILEDARSSSSRGEVGGIGGDPLYNAQDMRIRNFAVRERNPGSYGVEVVASFLNFNERHEVVFRLVPVGASWHIADIVYDNGTTLMGILKSNENSGERNTTVKVYLVAVGDEGKTGKKIGCGDSLVATNRSVQPTSAPLKAAITELIETPQHPAGNPRLENFWKGRNLRVVSVSILNNTATIRLAGEVFVAGICDIPRIESQIEETAKQFPMVKRVKVFIGSQTLRNALR